MGTRIDRGWHGGLMAVLLGAVLGAVVGAALYLLVTPVLEDADGWVRELQGLSWNLVPGLALAGGLVGARWGGGPRS